MDVFELGGIGGFSAEDILIAEVILSTVVDTYPAIVG